jgi:acetolactate synthase-1/2/3 large subunit
MPRSTTSGAELVYDALVDAGIDLLVEVPGHQTAALDRLLHERDEIAAVRARHETAVPHIAWGYFEAGGGPAATLVVPGPGDTNSMHGLGNALVDRVPLVHLTADVPPDHRGRGAIHELDPRTLDPVVKRNEIITDPHRLPAALKSGIGAAFARPAGPVRFSLPSPFFAAEIDDAGVEVTPERTSFEPTSAYDRAASLLSTAERPVVYVDNGVRRSPGATEAVRDLIDILDAPVVCSYKGAGVVPSDDPRFLSTAGLAMLAGARQVMERADVVLALGAYFDGPATGFWTLPTGDQLVHVTAEPELIDRSFTADVAVVADVADAARALADGIESPSGWEGSRIGHAVRAEFRERLDELGLGEDRAPAPSAAVFSALRDVLPDETISVIDIGHFRAWALATFDVYDPKAVVTPGSWTGMGIGVPGAIGAKLENPDTPVVTFIGDGCLLMCLQELHTAAEYEIDITTVVLNDADYGIISKQPELEQSVGERHFEWTSPDFTAIAEGFGCTGRHANTPSEAAEAMETALADDGPTLIDVSIDPEEPTPGQAVEYESTVPLD